MLFHCLLLCCCCSWFSVQPKEGNFFFQRAVNCCSLEWAKQWSLRTPVSRYLRDDDGEWMNWRMGDEWMHERMNWRQQYTINAYTAVVFVMYRFSFVIRSIWYMKIQVLLVRSHEYYSSSSSWGWGGYSVTEKWEKKRSWLSNEWMDEWIWYEWDYECGEWTPYLVLHTVHNTSYFGIYNIALCRIYVLRVFIIY